MPEQLLTHHEQHETLLVSPEHKALPTAVQAEKLRAGEPDPLQQLEQARANIEQHVEPDNPLKRLEAAEKASETPQPTHVNRELKQLTLHRELKQIRRKLPAPQRLLSRVVHQPVLRAVIEVTGKSLVRPSGLLGGGLLAFLGTSGYLYLAKHIGFSYNYFVFSLLFIAGFALGLVLELAVWTITSRRRYDS